MEKEKLRAASTGKLSQFIKSLGLELFGFTDAAQVSRCQPYYDKRPPAFFSAFETGAMKDKCQTTDQFISIAFPYAHDLNHVGEAYFSVYTRGEDYHRIVRGYLDKIIGFIHDLGYTAEAFTDSNSLPERLIAALSGVGYLGRNSLLITQDYGSYVFLGEIRTDLPLVSATSYWTPGDYTLCGDCRNCIRACPVGILGPDYVEAGRCLSEVTQKKHHSIEELKAMGGRLFGCDTCQSVCPHNRSKDGTGMVEFTPLPYMSQPDLWELVHLTKATFNDKYRITSAGWRGKAVLAKNALSALAHEGRLPENEDFDSPLVSEAWQLLRGIEAARNNDNEKR